MTPDGKLLSGRIIMRSSLCVVLLCSIGVVFGQYMPICDPTNYTGPPTIPLPTLPTQFSVVIEANFGQRNLTMNVKEYFDEVGNRGRFEVAMDVYTGNTVGIFDYDDGEIFMISDGDACEVKLIADPSTRRFLTETPIFGFQDGVNGSVHIGTVRDFFRLQRNTNATWLGMEVVRGIPCNRWQTCTVMENNSYTLDYYFATEDWEFALGDGPTPVQVVLNALNARKGGVTETLNHIYSFVSFNTGPRSVPDEVFTVPFGLACSGRIPGRPVPSFPEYFSLTLEAVQKTQRSVVVYKGFYDSPNNLVRVDAYYDGSQGGSPGPVSLIRDSDRNIDYIINRQFNNCTVMPLDNDAVYFSTVEGDSDVVAQITTPVTLLFFAQLFQYSYEGVTTIRGVDVDAWIGMQPYLRDELRSGLLEIRDGVWELFYTRPGWRITGDRTVNTEPALWRITIQGNVSFTSARDNTTTIGIYSGLYDIFDFSSEEPDFDIFDVSTCSSPSEYHVLSLAIPGHEQGLNFNQLRGNLRSAIVTHSNIQPLQVGNIQITGENGTHIFVSLHISNPTQLAATDDSKTADQILQMIQSGTINGRLPFQISTGVGTTMVTPLLLDVNPQECDSSCSGLNDGQAAGLGIGLLIVGLVCGILGTLLVLLVIKLCRSKSATPKNAPVSYEKQEDEVAMQ